MVVELRAPVSTKDSNGMRIVIFVIANLKSEGKGNTQDQVWAPDTAITLREHVDKSRKAETSTFAYSLVRCW